MADTIIAELRRSAGKGTGALQRSIDPANQLDRRQFDALLEAMVRAALIKIEDAVFEKDGEVIKFRKVHLADCDEGADDVELLIGDGIAADLISPGRVSSSPDKPRRRSQPAAAVTTASNRSANRGGENHAPEPPLELSGEALAIAERIKSWRKDEAKRLGVPAYVVLHDRTIGALAMARPRNPNQPLAVDGIGPAKVDKFGEPLLALIAGT
jgi:superfamily II DNA helicase RecQ